MSLYLELDGDEDSLPPALIDCYRLQTPFHPKYNLADLEDLQQLYTDIGRWLSIVQQVEVQRLVQVGRSYLEGAPTYDGRNPNNILGWTGTIGFVCHVCAGRVCQRGCSLQSLIGPGQPLYIIDIPTSEPIPPPCSLCETQFNHRGQPMPRKEIIRHRSGAKIDIGTV